MRSPSALKSMITRSERPIRRWISIVLPSWRPRVASRCLRSPVEAGSIPYSAVTHPLPWPAIQRGTLSCTEAVQITRVSPAEINADPVAVRMKPGSMMQGRRSSGARPWLRAAVCSVAMRPSFQSATVGEPCGRSWSPTCCPIPGIPSGAASCATRSRHCVSSAASRSSCTSSPRESGRWSRPRRRCADATGAPVSTSSTPTSG